MPSQLPNPRTDGTSSPSREPGKERLALYLFFCRTWRLFLPKGGKTKATFGWNNEHQGATGSNTKEVHVKTSKSLAKYVYEGRGQGVKGQHAIRENISIPPLVTRR